MPLSLNYSLCIFFLKLAGVSRLCFYSHKYMYVILDIEKELCLSNYCHFSECTDYVFTLCLNKYFMYLICSLVACVVYTSNTLTLLWSHQTPFSCRFIVSEGRQSYKYLLLVFTRKFQKQTNNIQTMQTNSYKWTQRSYFNHNRPKRKNIWPTWTFLQAYLSVVSFFNHQDCW